MRVDPIHSWADIEVGEVIYYHNDRGGSWPFEVLDKNWRQRFFTVRNVDRQVTFLFNAHIWIQKGRIRREP
jgi:hypothetical protein